MQVKECAKILSGYAFQSSLFNTEGIGIPIVRIRDVGESESNTFYSGQYSEEYILNNGDLLIGMDGQFNLAEWQGGKALLNQRVCKIIPDEKKLSKRFLAYTLPKSLKKIEDKTPYVTVKHLSVKTINEIELPSYDLITQQRIAKILDAADVLRKKTQQIIDSYDELAQAIFLDMFGDFNTYSFKPISKIAKFIDYRGKTPERVETGVPLISAKCVRQGYFDEKRLDYITNEHYNKIMVRGFPRIGDVLFTTEGATMGFTCRIPNLFEKFSVGQRLITLQAKEEFNSITLEYILRSKLVQNVIFKSATGSAAKGVRSAVFAKIKIPVAPISLQNQFAEKIQLIEKQKELAKQSLKESEDLFNALLQKAFRGELSN